MEYNCVLINLDWPAACIELRVVGAALVGFLRRWRKICTILQPMGSKGRYLKKCPKPCSPIRSKETCAKYAPTTLLGQRKLALTNREKYTFCVIKSLDHVKFFLNGPVSYFGLELTTHVIKSQIHLVRQYL